MSEELHVEHHKEPGIAQVSMRTALVLVAFVVVFTALMAFTYQASKPQLDASARAETLRLINEVLPPAAYDNDLLADVIVLPPQPALGLEAESRLYRARRGGKPVALVVEAAAPDGYSGRIGLILAMRGDGVLAAIRVTQHKETPGLGDYIDPKKDRKNKTRPWITRFNDIGHDVALGGQLKVRKDGGRIDQMAGATISARAVTNATAKALIWAAEHRERLFATPTGKRYEGKAL